MTCKPSDDRNVRIDLGGWISGPSLSGDPRTEPVVADHIRPGDVLDLDGRRAEVTDIRHGDYWLTTGTHGPGVAIGWRSESSSGVLFRRVTDLLRRVPTGPER